VIWYLMCSRYRMRSLHRDLLGYVILGVLVGAICTEIYIAIPWICYCWALFDMILSLF